MTQPDNSSQAVSRETSNSPIELSGTDQADSQATSQIVSQATSQTASQVDPQAASPWRFYNRLIEGVPDDIMVVDYAFGENWSFVEAECGMGIAYSCRGGAKRTHADDLRGLSLKNVAELSKSWNFEEASLGVAALNAWYTRRELLDPLGVIYDPIEGSHFQADEHPIQGDEPEGRRDAFDLYRPIIEAQQGRNDRNSRRDQHDQHDQRDQHDRHNRHNQHDQRGAKVVVVGHFPHVYRIAEYADLTVLERNCQSDLDTPDPACEYVMPEADYAFITGVTIINKTAPRLLELSRNAHTIMVGPSVIVTPLLFEWGVETLGGRVVLDPEGARYALLNGTPFGASLQMCTYTCPEAYPYVYPEG